MAELAAIQSAETLAALRALAGYERNLSRPCRDEYAAQFLSLPRRLLLSLLPVLAIFLVWDVVGIVRGHWWYSERYTTGVLFPFDVPLEEVVFFVVIPICGLLTYEAVGTVLGWWREWRARDA